MPKMIRKIRKSNLNPQELPEKKETEKAPPQKQKPKGILKGITLEPCQWGRFINSQTGIRYKVDQRHYHKLKQLCQPIKAQRLGPIVHAHFSLGDCYVDYNRNR